MLDADACGSAAVSEAAQDLSWSLAEHLLGVCDDLDSLAAEADHARSELAAADRALAGDAA